MKGASAVSAAATSARRAADRPHPEAMDDGIAAVPASSDGARSSSGVRSTCVAQPRQHEVERRRDLELVVHDRRITPPGRCRDDPVRRQLVPEQALIGDGQPQQRADRDQRREQQSAAARRAAIARRCPRAAVRHRGRVRRGGDHPARTQLGFRGARQNSSSGSRSRCPHRCPPARHGRVLLRHVLPPPRARRGLELVVDGVRHRPAAWGMPRPDLFATAPGCFRSGFWGTVPIGARRARRRRARGRARGWRAGPSSVAPLGRIPVVPAAPPPAAGAAGAPGLIAVCMATFEPDPALFRAQIESLRAQTDERWICVISDDCSSPERFEADRAHGRRRPALRACRARRGGSASTATSSAR